MNATMEYPAEQAKRLSSELDREIASSVLHVVDTRPARPVNERERFLEARRAGIGSSEVAKVLGVSKWGTALDVYLSKVNPSAASCISMTPQQEWGIRKEPAIAAAIMDRYGWELRKLPTLVHPEHRFLLASVDRMASSPSMPGAGEIVEIKTAERADGWGGPETDEIPEDYWLQVQHQLEILNRIYGTETCWVFVLIGASDFRRYRIAREPSYLDTFLEPLREFWARVETRTPPEPDWSHRTTLDTLQRLNQPQLGNAVELDAGDAALVAYYESLGEEAKAVKEKREEIKARIIAAMGRAEAGLLGDGRFVSRRLTKRAGYAVEPADYFDFRILKVKGHR